MGGKGRTRMVGRYGNWKGGRERKGVSPGLCRGYGHPHGYGVSMGIEILSPRQPWPGEDR